MFRSALRAHPHAQFNSWPRARTVKKRTRAGRNQKLRLYFPILQTRNQTWKVPGEDLLDVAWFELMIRAAELFQVTISQHHLLEFVLFICQRLNFVFFFYCDLLVFVGVMYKNTCQEEKRKTTRQSKWPFTLQQRRPSRGGTVWELFPAPEPADFSR